MNYAERNQLVCSKDDFVYEEKDNVGWSRNSKSLAETDLENEISYLRNEMEQAVGLEKSLNSELVVRLSSMLDRKINEYMKKRFNKK